MSKNTSRLFSTVIQDLKSLTPTTVNGISYNVPPPGRPIVGICLDGSSQQYIDEATQAGLMPNWNAILNRQKQRGCWGLVSAVMPTFTNPNNVAIICGNTPDKNGICGNFFYNQEEDREVMMTDPSFLRSESILGKLSSNTKQPVFITMVTAKDKLRRLLSHGLNPKSSLVFSIEQQHQLREHKKDKTKETDIEKIPEIELETLIPGREIPSIYDPLISLYCLEVGLQLIRKNGSSKQHSLYYLTTTDYVQHRHKPGTYEANSFYNKLDKVLGDLDEAGAVIGVTADHGMSDKVSFNGEAKVVYLETILQTHFIENFRVILPITDPYVKHHASLGSYATIYIKDESKIDQIMSFLRKTPGIYTVFNREEACKSLDLPPDRIGDIVVVADSNAVLGKSEEFHQTKGLSSLTGLRSHGGFDEQTVPMWFNFPLAIDYRKRLTRGLGRNFHLFEFLLNGIDFDETQKEDLSLVNIFTKLQEKEKERSKLI